MVDLLAKLEKEKNWISPNFNYMNLSWCLVFWLDLIDNKKTIQVALKCQNISSGKSIEIGYKLILHNYDSDLKDKKQSFQHVFNAKNFYGIFNVFNFVYILN